MNGKLHEFLLRMRALVYRKRMDSEIAEELEFHQEMLRTKLLQEGAAPAEAERTIRRRFGDAARWQERLRELWQFRTMESLKRDVNLAAWRMTKSRGFAVVAVATLALGVGANTAVFSLINGLLLRPLPAPHAEQLVVLRIEEGGPEPNYALCTPFFRSLEKRHDVFTDVFGYNHDTLQVRDQSGNENIPGVLVSGQFFQALETPPLRGRYLTPQDDQPGGGPTGWAVVISEGFWNHWFNRAPDVVGRKLVIANTAFTVVGVMPKRFIGADPMERPEIFAPLSADPIIDAPRNHIDAGLNAWWITAAARLESGVTVNQANAELLTISDPILRQDATDARYVAEEERSHFHFAAEPGSRGYVYARSLFRKPLAAMFSMCGGMLLLTCLNLASLLMARGAARKRELATRLALGATRRRLIQQLLTESMLIALLGTVAGLAVAPLVSHSLSALLTAGDNAVQLDTSLDLRVFGFAALMAVAATLLIGLVPALQATAGDLNEHIRNNQHASRGNERRSILPRVLLACEVALALVLAVGAGLLAMSLSRLMNSGIGFDPKGLVNISFSMDKQPLTGDALMQLYRQLGEGLSHQPGVKGLSFQFIVPLAHRGWNGNYSTAPGGTHLIDMNSVGPAYFRTMRIPLYSGREFGWNDTKTSGLKIILNRSAAKLFFPGENALGRQVVNAREKTAYEVVAVVGDAKYRDMRAPAPPTGYVPMQQDEQEKPSLTAVVRTDGPPAPLAGAARALAARLAPAIPAPVFTTMDDVVDASVDPERLMALLSAFFAGCALLVMAIGLYGTLAYTTARRTSEIGIRMALGARRAQVVALVCSQNATVTLFGVMAGLIASMLASRALASFLYGTSARDPWVMAGSVMALTLIAGAASLFPALGAARIDPMAAIRCE